MKQLNKVLAVLKEAPATSGEVMALTDLPRKHSCNLLRQLWQMGVAERKLMAKIDTGPGRRGYLYTLVRS